MLLRGGGVLVGVRTDLRRVLLGARPQLLQLLLRLEAGLLELRGDGGGDALRLGVGVRDDPLGLGPRCGGPLLDRAGLRVEDGATLRNQSLLLRTAGGEGELEVLVGLGGAAAGVGEQPLRLGAQARDVLHGVGADRLGLILGEAQDLLDAGAQMTERDLAHRTPPAQVSELHLQVLNL
ncbi:hypothetical protein OHA72_00925 [Dactylosporangium sp. NBC_01737]|uniref:hypothetical protein n=1 Tax=Dactylosporangium sp. NBC_01737 TaxID=2975959 RepID=UPI002E13CA93|nr:hypothetical protein OHA72_00925 [Dactylosporangium sp. NBC_01737]